MSGSIQMDWSCLGFDQDFHPDAEQLEPDAEFADRLMVARIDPNDPWQRFNLMFSQMSAQQLYHGTHLQTLTAEGGRCELERKYYEAEIAEAYHTVNRPLLHYLEPHERQGYLIKGQSYTPPTFDETCWSELLPMMAQTLRDFARLARLAPELRVLADEWRFGQQRALAEHVDALTRSTRLAAMYCNAYGLTLLHEYLDYPLSDDIHLLIAAGSIGFEMSALVPAVPVDLRPRLRALVRDGEAEAA